MRKSTFDRIMLRRQTNRLWAEAEQHEDSNPKLRFKLLRRMVRLGHNDPGILQNLASAYAAGEGTRPSRRLAQDLNRKAWRNGSEGAACNAGIDALRGGRQVSARIWFNRAVTSGNSDALLHLAKLLLNSGKPDEARTLLQRRVDLGEETWFEITGQGEQQACEDEIYAEAKRLLKPLQSEAA